MNPSISIVQESDIQILFQAGTLKGRDRIKFRQQGLLRRLHLTIEVLHTRRNGPVLDAACEQGVRTT